MNIEKQTQEQILHKLKNMSNSEVKELQESLSKEIGKISNPHRCPCPLCRVGI